MIRDVSPIEELARTHEQMAVAVRKVIELGITVPKEEPEPESETQVSLEEVRGVLAEKSRDGFTKEVREIIERHGGQRLSDIPQSCYGNVLREAEVLGNG